MFKIHFTKTLLSVPFDSNGDQGHLSNFRMIGRPKLGPRRLLRVQQAMGQLVQWKLWLLSLYQLGLSDRLDGVPTHIWPILAMIFLFWQIFIKLTKYFQCSELFGGNFTKQCIDAKDWAMQKIIKPKECKRVADCFRKEICRRFTENSRCQENYCVFQEILQVLN